MHSCIYEGSVRHRRRRPVRHAFGYRLYLMYLDLDELPRLLSVDAGLSEARWSLARYAREDHVGERDQPLADAVRDLVEQQTGRRPAGPVRVLTDLRRLGTFFDPLVLYYCFDAVGAALEAVVARVSNTPWGERHCYVLEADASRPPAGPLRFTHDKRFHVSPFMDMDQRYAWRLNAPGARLAVRIESHDADGPLFDAALAMVRRPLDRAHVRRMRWRYPWMPGRVLAAIYYQALRLWMKRVPFFPHPKHRLGPPAASSPSTSAALTTTTAVRG